MPLYVLVSNIVHILLMSVCLTKSYPNVVHIYISFDSEI